MVLIHKIIGAMSCGFVLCLGLAGNAALAADKVKPDPSGQSADRLGGQAGLESEEGKLKGLSGDTPERIGGQAGLESEEGKLKGLTGQTPERLGGQAGLRADEEKLKGALLGRDRTIKGEVFRVEYGDYFVKGQDGKEVRLHTDRTTQMMGQVKKGDRIEAKVNDQNHVFSIRPTQ